MTPNSAQELFNEIDSVLMADATVDWYYGSSLRERIQAALTTPATAPGDVERVAQAMKATEDSGDLFAPDKHEHSIKTYRYLAQAAINAMRPQAVTVEQAVRLAELAYDQEYGRPTSLRRCMRAVIQALASAGVINLADPVAAQNHAAASVSQDELRELGIGDRRSTDRRQANVGWVTVDRRGNVVDRRES